MEKTKELFQELRAAILQEFYAEAYNRIQSLGRPGFHDAEDINRGDALRALNIARRKLLAQDKEKLNAADPEG